MKSTDKIQDPPPSGLIECDFSIMRGRISSLSPAWVTYLDTIFKTKQAAGWCWHTPLIPALGRQRQVDLSESDACLVSKGNSRPTSSATQRNPVWRNLTQNQSKINKSIKPKSKITKENKNKTHKHVLECWLSG